MLERATMALPYVGDLVLFVGHANSFRGMRGRVVAIKPYLMVIVDGDTHPMRFDAREVITVEERETNMSGAE